MSRQYWSETLSWATSNGTAVNSANVETILFPNVTVPANYLQDGRCLRIRAQGIWTTTGSTPTLIFNLRWGGVAGTLLCNTAAITTVASTTAAMWEVDILVQTRSKYLDPSKRLGMGQHENAKFHMTDGSVMSWDASGIHEHR